MPKSILVVHEQRHIGRLIQVNLERAGYLVQVTAEIGEALRQAEQQHPDLIVQDALVPIRPSGYNILTYIKGPSPLCLLKPETRESTLFPDDAKDFMNYIRQYFREDKPDEPEGRN